MSKLLTINIVVVVILTRTVHAGLFSMTDGSAETWGGTSNGDVLSLNHFNTAGQTVIIDQINAAWNPLSALVRPTLVLYSDPNGDGNPSDAHLLLSYSLSLPPNLVILNQSLQSYVIPQTTVTGSFFVGTFLSDRESDFNPLTGIDTSHPQSGQSWIIENSHGTGLLNLNNPIGTSTLVTGLNTFINGNFMIEAHYIPVPEPPPGYLVIVLACCAMLLRQTFRSTPSSKFSGSTVQ